MLYSAATLKRRLTRRNTSIVRQKRKLQCILVILLSITCFLFIASGKRIPPLIEDIISHKVIEEVSGNPSGLTWDENTNMLMAVTNRAAIGIKIITLVVH